MNQQFLKDASGRLFPRTNPAQDTRQPTWQGDIVLPAELLQALLQLSQQRGGGDVRLRVVAWDKQGKTGHFLSLSGRVDRFQPGDDPNAIPRHYPTQGVQRDTRPPSPHGDPNDAHQPHQYQEGHVRPGPHPGQTRPVPHVAPRQGPQQGPAFNDNPNFYQPRTRDDDDPPPWQ